MGFTCKARYVANEAMTDTPVGLFYLSVLYRDSVIITFSVAALNDLESLACDISNAYLHAPFRERICFVSGLECGKSIKGKLMKLVRVLYGLKITGASWRKMFKYHVVNCLGFNPSTIDPDMFYQSRKRWTVMITMRFCWFMLTTY